MATNFKEQEFTKGQKLFITLLDNRKLEGIFNRRSDARKSIVIHDVSFVPSNGKTIQQLEFKSDELLSIDWLQEEKNQNSINASQTSTLSSPGVETLHPQGTFYDKIKDSVENHVFINQVDARFHQAVGWIDNADCIAVVGQGSEQGRFSQLSVLGIATLNRIFLFDILNFGSSAFQACGSILKKVLESKDVLKVVHSCALLADCLKHKHGINLQNVFDTQACHVIVVKNRSGQTPSNVSLSNLVAVYLKLPGSLCNFEVTDRKLWLRRPLEKEMAQAIAWKAALVRFLKSPLEDALYAPFDNLCHAYLSSVRELDDELEAKILMQELKEDCVPKI